MEEQANLYIAGRNPVREALQRGDREFEKVLLQQGASGGAIEEIRRAANRAGAPVRIVPAATLSRLVPGTNHQGVLALTSPVAFLDLDDMLAQIAPAWEDVQKKKPLLLLLDQIEDPHNFGAILRSAVAAGANGVIVPRHRMAPVNATVIKASAGMALRIPLARVTNLADTLVLLKERGYWIIGAAGEGSDSVWDMDWDRPAAIIIGSESGGLRPRVAAGCDHLVRIPMRGQVDSLNASVAAGILLFAAVRHRSSP